MIIIQSNLSNVCVCVLINFNGFSSRQRGGGRSPATRRALAVQPFVRSPVDLPPARPATLRAECSVLCCLRCALCVVRWVRPFAPSRLPRMQRNSTT